MVDRPINHGLADDLEALNPSDGFLYGEVGLRRHGKNCATRPAPRVCASFLAILRGLMPDNESYYQWSLGLADRATTIAIEKVDQRDLRHIHLVPGSYDRALRNRLTVVAQVAWGRPDSRSQ